MKKFLLIMFLLLCMPTLAFAATFEKIGYRAYSTASAVTCYVQGGEMGKDLYTGASRNAFDIWKSSLRTLALGTKGFKNYSAHSLANVVSFQCYNASNAATLVKVFFDSVETTYFPMSSGMFNVKP